LVNFIRQYIGHETTTQIFKTNSSFLAVIFMVQSCSVYHSYTVTTDEAISSSKKIKVKSVTETSYKFNSLEIVEGQLYGIAHKKSKTAKVLSKQIVQYQSDNVKILLTKDQVNEIYIEDKMRSGILSILGVFVALGGGLALATANLWGTL
jgi:hypothetical protein